MLFRPWLGALRWGILGRFSLEIGETTRNWLGAAVRLRARVAHVATKADADRNGSRARSGTRFCSSDGRPLVSLCRSGELLVPCAVEPIDLGFGFIPGDDEF